MKYGIDSYGIDSCVTCHCIIMGCFSIFRRRGQMHTLCSHPPFSSWQSKMNLSQKYLSSSLYYILSCKVSHDSFSFSYNKGSLVQTQRDYDVRVCNFFFF